MGMMCRLIYGLLITLHLLGTYAHNTNRHGGIQYVLPLNNLRLNPPHTEQLSDFSSISSPDGSVDPQGSQEIEQRGWFTDLVGSLFFEWVKAKVIGSAEKLPN
ncbi:hypothetical protein PPYR_10394 [Photinus pyralis]|uniref:Secreted protein n=1 Tax=Photinus pyralis TaxID=7054 RepID=A0A5N4AGA1_PHOPY|nr:uncharacterized protein LOC116174954 [Photinus pyralis]KAB0796333.1 hypothetical protein PPYR_10394 [Photinus pyralis]